MDVLFERFHEIFALPLSQNVTLFCLILAIILIVPIITQKLHIPQVIGLILVGIVIGPHALNIVDNTGAISLFSTIGLLYIMFTAGLELDINQFKLNKNRSLAFGFLTWAGPLLFLFPICFWIYDLDALPSFLVGCMFATHTLIAYPAVSRLGVSADPSVAVSVGATIIVDTLVLIILSIVLGLSAGNLSVAFWLQLAISLLLFSVFMIVVVPKIGAWFYAHWHREHYLRYIFTLFMVFCSALLALMAGLEGIIGAFIAGLMLNRFIPKNSQLMHQIEFVGNTIFIPIFLLTVGMLVNIGVITSGPKTILLALVLSAAALAGKFAAAWIAQKWFHYSSAQRNTMFGLSAARVAATLAVVIVAHNAGLIDESFLNAAILLILITCITASFVTESAAKKLAIERDKNMTHAPDKENDFSHLLLPIANPNHAFALLDFAGALLPQNHLAKITMLSVVPNSKNAEENIRIIRENIQKTFHHELDPKTHHLSAVIDANIPDGIARAAKEQLSDAIILGWPKADFSEHFIGEKWKAVVHDTNKRILWCDFPVPTQKMKRLILLTLPNAEHAPDFNGWTDLILKIAHHYALSILLVGQQSAFDAFQARAAFTQKNIPLSSQIESHIEKIHHHLSPAPSDWIVFVSARPNTIAHSSLCEKAPAFLSENYKNHNKILIYPAEQFENIELDDFEMV